MAHLIRVARGEADDDWGTADFPFGVPAIATLPTLDLSAPVTFFVGENGSGKSTLLEAIACQAQLRAVGSEELWRDPTLSAQRVLGKSLQLTWRGARTRRGFFLRAEDFFGYLRRESRTDARLARERQEAATGLASESVWPHAEHPDEAAAAPRLRELDSRSHGESFFDLFQAGVRGEGLYLLDEPESPLSPRRQLAFLALLGEAVQRGAQFVVATHSPILLAYPGARIYSFDDPPVREVPFRELEHVTVTRDFLQAPERYLRHLI